MTDEEHRSRKAQQRAEADAFLADPAVDTPRYLPVLIVAPTAARVRMAQPGEVFYDAAGFVSVQCVTNAAKVGDHISLYMGGRYGCTRAHVEAAWTQGAGVVPNWERNADQALKGYTDGRAAVDSAMVTAAQWGMDETRVPVAYSGVDFGPTTAQYPALDDWHRGVQDRSDELGVAQPIAYGHTGYLGHLSQQSWWRGGTWVWAGAGTFAGMTVKQRLNPTRDVSHIGCTVDEDLVATSPSYPLAVWTGEGFTPQEEDLLPDERAALMEIHKALVEMPGDPPAPDGLSVQWAVYNAYSNTKAMREWLTADSGLSADVRGAVITVLRSPEAQGFFVRHTPEDLVAIANAVVAALPPMTGGIRTLQEFKDAVDGW